MTLEEIEQQIVERYREKKAELVQAENKKRNFRTSSWDDQIAGLKAVMLELLWMQGLVSQVRDSQELPLGGNVL